MTFVLPLPSQSPLKRSFSDSPYLHTAPTHFAGRSCYSVFSRDGEDISAASPVPLKPLGTKSQYRNDENKRLAFDTKSILEIVETVSSTGTSPSICDFAFPEKIQTQNLGDGSVGSFINNNANCNKHLEEEVDQISQGFEATDEEEAGILTSLESLNESKDARRTSTNDTRSFVANTDDAEDPKRPTQPFRKWVDTLRRRNIDHHHGLTAPKTLSFAQALSQVRACAATHEPRFDAPEVCQGHKKSMSITSSFGFVAAMKSASVTIASASIAPIRRSRSTKTRRNGDYSSQSDPKLSLESTRPYMFPLIDDGAWDRAVERRKILLELVSSEESYICDMKLLVNAYFTLLASVPSISARSRCAFHKNIAQILQLHEDLLVEIQKCVFQSSQHGKFLDGTQCRTKAKHARWQSTDATLSRSQTIRPPRQMRHSLDLRRNKPDPKLCAVADTKVVGQVGKIFNDFTRRFFVYEAFGAQWNAMKIDIEEIRKYVPLSAYEKGTEALASSLLSVNARELKGKKGLTYEDLLIKPIQRMSKYPLIFERLCKQTPVIDDPEAHSDLEKALFRLKEANSEINRATNDPETRKLIEATWILQDRLHFEEQSLSSAVIFRLLGHVNLCGVLHVTLNSMEKVFGQYMICILYRSSLILALLEKSTLCYRVVASIGLAGGAVEDCDNGRGLQCYTAPFTWKLVFESGQRLFEIILSACSSAEEDQWRTRLRNRISAENQDLLEGRTSTQDMICYMRYNLKPLGAVFGQPESFARKSSVHRAATLGAKPGFQQIIIKNTQAQILDQDPTAPSVTRSKSYQSPSSIPTLAPRRITRARLELALSDVWTRECLPYPGILPKRSENGIRASANSVMRKLSMASLASNFSKRSPSLTSSNNSRFEDAMTRMRKPMPAPISNAKKGDSRKAPILVDFHNAPNAFLPTDFEIGKTSNQKGILARYQDEMPCRINDQMRLPSPSYTIANSPQQCTPRRKSNASAASYSRPPSQTTISKPTTTSGRIELRKRDSHKSKHRVTGTIRTPARPVCNRSFKQKGSRLFKFWT